jgi:hypothetical protein
VQKNIDNSPLKRIAVVEVSHAPKEVVSLLKLQIGCCSTDSVSCKLCLNDRNELFAGCRIVTVGAPCSFWVQSF